MGKYILQIGLSELDNIKEACWAEGIDVMGNGVCTSSQSMKNCMKSMKLTLVAALFVILCTAQYFSFQYTYSLKKEYHIRVEVRNE